MILGAPGSLVGNGNCRRPGRPTDVDVAPILSQALTERHGRALDVLAQPLKLTVDVMLRVPVRQPLPAVSRRSPGQPRPIVGTR
jgi:hypothetical protein